MTPDRPFALLATAGLVALLLAGCLADNQDQAGGLAPGDDPVAAAMAAIGEPIVTFHDHNDPHLHTASHNLDLLSWNTLDVSLGDNGFANFVLWQSDDGAEDLAFVAVDGDAAGGFVIADIADPDAVSVLGRYWVDGNSIQEVRVTPDGQTAFMNVQDIPDPNAWTDGDGPRDCTVCIHVVDVSDRAAPQLLQILPVELLGTHNFHVEEVDDDVFLYYVGQPLYLPYPDPGNHVYISQLVDTPLGPRLVPVGSFDHNEVQKEGRSFPHDVLVQEHPVTGQRVAYVSHWDGGVVTFDVTDPLLPVKMGVNAEMAPSDALAIHWVMQEETARDDEDRPLGRVIAWSAPEIGGLETGSGLIRAYDATDPGALVQIGTWELPGDVTIEGAYTMSPHTAIPNQDNTLLAVGHYHAGVWILDITDPTQPRHVAFYQPHGDPAAPYDGPLWWKKPNFDPEGYGPNVYQARWDPDEPTLLWVTDRGTGLYAFEYTGPVPS
ncbi:MAG: LVIVD repeat-containing protein [Thermoplasmatota archaeon]